MKILAFIVALAWMSESHAVGFQESFASAYFNHPRLLAMREESDAASARVWRQYLAYLPTVSAQASVGTSKVESKTAFFSADENRDPRAASLNITQPIFEGGAKIARILKAEENQEAQIAQTLEVMQEILLEAITAYLNLVQDQELVKLARHNEQLLSREKDEVTQRYELGDSTQTDVSQSEARLASARATTAASQATLAGTRARFIQVTQLDDTHPADQEPPLIGQSPSSLGDALTRAQSHPTIRKHRHEWQAARQEVSESFAVLLPSLELEGSVGRQFDSFNKGSRSDSLTATARLRMNIVSASDYATIDEKRSLRRSKEYLYHNAKEHIKQEATAAWHQWQASSIRVRALRNQVKANRLALDGVQSEEELGQRDVLDVLNAEQELFQSQSDLVRSKRDHALSHYRLLQAVGELTPQTLAISTTKD